MRVITKKHVKTGLKSEVIGRTCVSRPFAELYAVHNAFWKLSTAVPRLYAKHHNEVTAYAGVPRTQVWRMCDHGSPDLCRVCANSKNKCEVHPSFPAGDIDAVAFITAYTVIPYSQILDAFLGDLPFVMTM